MNPAMPSDASRCQRCQAELPQGKDSGHCPRCLLELAMRTGAAPTTARPGERGGAPPSIEVLQPLLPAYELQTLLGRGGMGAVYRARHRKLDRLVAIKILLEDLVRDPAFAERFEREARALALLKHPGIVGVHDFGRAGDFFFLVMEHVDGASLRDLLTQGKLTTRDVLAFAPQLCDALQYAHDHGVVHRDIKPENILVDLDGKVHVADFGLAKMTGSERPDLGLTRTQQVLGTPLYMAPEQIGAASAVDHRADLYSLGVVLYEMLTGNLPIGRFQPPSTKSLDAQPFDRVVMRSLENDPGQRYQQAREVKHDVEAAGEPAPRPAVPVSDAVQGAASPTSWGPLVVAAVVLVATFFDWVQVDPTHRGNEAITTTREIVGRWTTASAWHTWAAGVPLGITVPIALAYAGARLVRDRWRRGPRFLPLGLAYAGVLLCGYAFVEIAITHRVHAALGLWIATITFAIAVAVETAQSLRSEFVRSLR